MRISVFGLGIIGSIWAQHWRADGHEVKAWNRTPKPDFPGYCADPKEVAQDADLIAIVVSDGVAAKEVLTQIESQLNSRTVVAQHSTIGWNETQQLAEWVEQKGAHFLDMPFSGSRTESEKRQTLFFVGDKGNILEKVEPVYRRISKAIFQIGNIGQGTVLKLSLNLLASNLYQALAEAYVLAEKGGLSGNLFFSVLDQHACRSALTDAKKEKILRGEYSSNFSVQHMHKDLKLILDLARNFSQPVPQTQTLIQSYDKALNQGWGQQDFAAVIETLK